MLEERYLVQDDSWKQYPTANSIDKWILSRILFKGAEEPDEEVLAKRVAKALRKETDVLRYLSPEERTLMKRLFQIVNDEIQQIQEVYDLRFNIRLYQKRLWLLDEFGKRLMSGFFDLLYVDPSKNRGLLVKHTFTSETLIPAQKNKELFALALIASEAFTLKSVELIALNWKTSSIDVDFGSHESLALRIFKQQIQQRLTFLF